MRLRDDFDFDVKFDIVVLGILSLFSEVYDWCGEVCVEYVKIFYLGEVFF